VQAEAVCALADMAGDVVRRQQDCTDHNIAVEVRDDNGPVLQAKIIYEVKRRLH